MSAPGATLTIYHGHSERVNTVAWSPDNLHIASGSWDKTMQVWDASDGHTILAYRGHAVSLWNYVEAVAWSPNGTRIASDNDDWQAHVWAAP